MKCINEYNNSPDRCQHPVTYHENVLTLLILNVSHDFKISRGAVLSMVLVLC